MDQVTSLERAIPAAGGVSGASMEPVQGTVDWELGREFGLVPRIATALVKEL